MLTPNEASTASPEVTIFQLLEALPYDALRRIGSHLKLSIRGSARHQKRTWVITIATAWDDAVSAGRNIAHMPAEANGAYHRLRRAPGLPASLFFAEFGGLRPLRLLRTPYSPAEHLFLSGLLHGLHGGTPHSASRLYAAPISLDLETAAVPDTRPAREHDPRISLHDLSQLLAFLAMHPEVHLQHGRWVSPNTLRAINRLLLSPCPLAPRTTHKQCDGLRTLWFLAVQTRLIDRTMITAFGWAWADLPPADQLRMLWHSWLNDDIQPDARVAYHQPDAAWGGAARHRCATFLAHRNAPFAAADLADALLTDDAFPPAFYTAHFATLADVEAAMAHLLTTVLIQLSVVEALDATHFVVTPTGRWLAGAPDARPPTNAWTSGTASLATWSGASNQDERALRIAWHTSPSVRLALALFSTDLSLDLQPERTAGNAIECFHTLTMKAASLAAAASRGLPMASFWQALTDLEMPLHSVNTVQLSQWWEAGDQVKISRAALLRTREPAQLARLVQHSQVQPFLSELLSPTVAVWTGDPYALQGALRDAGLPAYVSDSSEAAMYGDPGLLWLAARLYQLLGRWLPLPALLDEQAVQYLASQLGPTQQEHLDALAIRLEERLADLLDNLPFTPPSTPSDPELWRRQIDEAIAGGHSLDLIYFSAGRNLTTRRRVEPYWIEEHHSTPYLRGYCHSAGRVLTFRLDRIESIERG